MRKLAGELLEDRRLLALSTTDLTSGLTPFDLAQALIGTGVAISNVQFTGDNTAGGLFTGGLSEGLEIESGVLLSSGAIADAAGPNESEFTTTDFDRPGDADLESLIPGFEVFDATILEFDFVVTEGTVSFLYVFGSEEYNEFVDQEFNDVFGFFLNGVNIALIPGTTTPVSINNVNNGLNSSFYNDNSPADLGIPTPFGTQADGFTVPLQATATVGPGTHHIKLAIGDAGDGLLDSWVFLAANSFVSGESDIAVSLTASPNPAILESAFTYNVTVTNNGPDLASGVTARDVLPAGVTFVSATSSQGTVANSGGVINANLGLLESGASATVAITVIANQLGSITNTVTAKAFQIDDAQENNEATLVIDVVPPSLFVSDTQVVEGNTGTRDAVFTISLNGPLSTSDVTVQYGTADGTANGGTDYVPVFGSVVIPAGSTAITVTVPVIGDIYNEGDETFNLVLHSATNSSITKGVGVGTIIDDDRLPAFYVNDVEVKSTQAGTLAAVFTVALDVVSGRAVRVHFRTVDGTALAGSDYVSQSGELVFPAFTANMQVTVPVTTSDLYSANELFALQLSNPDGAVLADAWGVCTGVFADDPPLQYILDDGGPGYTRTNGWVNVTNLIGYQSDYEYHAPGSGNESARWTVTNVAPGSYQVFTRWVPFNNRATNAPYTILDGSTSRGTVLVNQRLAPAGELENGITWQNLGTFQIDTGVISVRLSDNANGYVIADAVRIVPHGIPSPVPEIDIAHAGDSIDDGETIPSVAEGTDFGNVLLNSDSPVHTFTIRNTGNAPLLLTGNPRVQVVGDDPGEFVVLSQPAPVVAPGGTTSFSVLFHPTASGLRQAVISVDNNDQDESEYRFLIQGNGSDGNAEAPVQNFVQPTDVNGDLQVTPLDVLIVFNALQQRQSSGQSVTPLAAGDAALSATTVVKPRYLDVDGNGLLSPLDALQVINHLLRQSASANQTASPAANPTASPAAAAAPSAATPALQAFAIDQAIGKLTGPAVEPVAVFVQPANESVVDPAPPASAASLIAPSSVIDELYADQLYADLASPVDDESDDELELNWK